VVVPSKESCSESLLVYLQVVRGRVIGMFIGGMFLVSNMEGDEMGRMGRMELMFCSVPGIPTGVSIGRLSGFAEEPDMVFPSKSSIPLVFLLFNSY
jgi:hypothetical protein